MDTRGGNHASEVVNTIVQRSDLLSALNSQSMDKRRLVDECDYSRSTINRAVRDLEALELVEYTNGALQLTPCGQLLTEHYQQFEELAMTSMRLAPFLQWFPTEDCTLSLQHLAEAELYCPEPTNPYAMVNQHVQRIEAATSFEGVLPLVSLHGIEAAHTQVLQHGATHELIISSAILDTFRSDEQFTPLVVELLETDRCSLFLTEKPIPYFVGCFDDEYVQIGVDDAGEPRALVEATATPVREWAHGLLDEYKAAATELTPTAIQDEEGRETGQPA